MIVDDEKDIREKLSQGIVLAGYECITAEDGKCALDIMAREDVDVVISDISMPEMDGIAACEELRKIPALKSTVIAFLTARVQLKIEEEFPKFCQHLLELVPGPLEIARLHRRPGRLRR